MSSLIFFPIGPTWNGISFITGTSCGLKYEICFNKPLLNHHFSCGTQDLQLLSFFLAFPPVALLAPSGALFPSCTFSHCLQTKTPKQYSLNSQILPWAPESDRTESFWLLIEWRMWGGKVPLCKLRKGSENRKDSAALKGFCAGFSF